MVTVEVQDSMSIAFSIASELMEILFGISENMKNINSPCIFTRNTYILPCASTDNEALLPNKSTVRCTVTNCSPSGFMHYLSTMLYPTDYVSVPGLLLFRCYFGGVDHSQYNSDNDIIVVW